MKFSEIVKEMCGAVSLTRNHKMMHSRSMGLKPLGRRSEKGGHSRDVYNEAHWMHTLLIKRIGSLWKPKEQSH